MKLDNYDKLKNYLVGKTIVHVVEGIDENQMDFILMFDDGTKLEVSAS